MADLKLHLGCGWRTTPGWHHRDIAPYPHLDSRGSISDLGLFEDASVTEIYASHVLEYFDHVQVSDVLAEWRRVMIPKAGTLRVAVPDFNSLCRIYELTGSVASVRGPLFGRMEAGDDLIYHKSVWDYDSMAGALKEAGFSRVEKYNPIEFTRTLAEDYDDHSLAFFPHMDQTGVQVSLCIMANT